VAPTAASSNVAKPTANDVAMATNEKEAVAADEPILSTTPADMLRADTAAVVEMDMAPTDTAAVGASPTAADGVVAKKKVEIANGNLPV